jgi:ATP-binding cassette subfamily B protein
MAPDEGARGWGIVFEEVSFRHERKPALQIESEPTTELDDGAPGTSVKTKTKTNAEMTNPGPGSDPSRAALTEVSFRIEPGQTVAVVGPTGAGKSTLLQLIPGFYQPTSGRIFVSGRPLNSISRAELCRGIAVVFQDTFLFSSSIAENIAFGRPEATREEIVQAAQAACADGFVRELAQGYETIIGERGVSLSGGQRQRLALARAFLRQPKILILDDSTSAIDATTEREIQDATRELRRGRTTVLVAQRVASVRTADLILVMQAGRIVEQGQHNELLARKGLYAELFASQLDSEPGTRGK